MSAPAAPKIPGRILVIDDDRSARMLLERVLTRAGHIVTLVDTAEDGFTRLKAEPFDLLITDKNLPGLDGLEVLKQARAAQPRLRALLITGFPTPETQVAANDLGVHAYVTKPFGVHDILDICESAIRASREVPA
ncbi:MAG: response regulator [Myxococcales bacterium]|nr:response regulator [Myxococcales bacterium]